MLRRASRSHGAAVARSMCPQPRHRPSSAMPSAGGLKAGERNVSMQCAIAPIPVAAVSSAGNDAANEDDIVVPLLHRDGEIAQTQEVFFQLGELLIMRGEERARAAGFVAV